MSRREPAASPFRDLSNLRTPRPNRKQTASAQGPTPFQTPLQGPTPTPLRHRRPVAGSVAPKPTPHDRRLREFEIDQSRTASRAEAGRERALRTFAASASSWLSLLLRDPAACGCSPAAGSAAAAQPDAAGKRGPLEGELAYGRSPKRRRGGHLAAERRKGMTPAMATALNYSLREACSLDDVTERMGRYMSKDAYEDVLVMMCKICKNIDEGRLKMKADCPLVTDLRLKEKATRIFMCYNPHWLRIGLYIVLGSDSLLNGQEKRDTDIPFLKLILDKKFFAPIMKEKTFADKNMVRGHHKQGYSEALGNVILKRLFLIVAVLDRAKVESALPLENGIDGLDGGSPLLFCHQEHIKSSQQIIQESLGEVMHGEGDLMTHLTTVGYNLNYQQPAPSEYDFTVRSLFEDLQDGVILCRVVQLLLCDASIILKVIAPSDTHKKKLYNSTMAMDHIRQAGVPLSDSDGVAISAEDIVTGDKELTLSLLWNIFVHMQLPLLADKTSLACELSRLQEPVMEQLMPENKSHIRLLYDWVEVVCSKYGMSFESTSQFDRSTLGCIIQYYLNIDAFPLKETLTGCQKELFSCHELDTVNDVTSCPYSKIRKVVADLLEDIPASGILTNDVLCDERSAILLLAFLASRLTNEKRLGQLKNLIDIRFNCQNPEIKISVRRRSRGKNEMKQKSPQIESKDDSQTKQDWAATIIQTQARRMIAKIKYCNHRKTWSAVAMKRNSSCLSTASVPWVAHGNDNRYFVFMIERHRFVQMRKCATMIQRALRVWIKRRKGHTNNVPFEKHESSETATPTPSLKQCSGDNKAVALTTPMHCKSVNTQRDSAAPSLYTDGTWCQDSGSPLQLRDKRCNCVISPIQIHQIRHESTSPFSPLVSMSDSSYTSTSHLLCEVETSIEIAAPNVVSEDDMDCSNDISSRFFVKNEETTWTDLCIVKEVAAAKRIQSACRRFLQNRKLRATVTAAIKIKSHWRGLLARKCFARQVQAIIAIQTSTRTFLYHRDFQKQLLAVKLIQRVVRGWLARKRILGSSSLQSYTICVRGQNQHRKCYQSLELQIVLDSVLRLQRCWRMFLLRQSMRTSVISIQSFVRGCLSRKQQNRIICCAKIIQMWWRKVLFLKTRKRAVTVIQAHFRGWIARQAATRKRRCITIIQTWWRKALFLETRKRAVSVIQAHYRGSTARQAASRKRRCITIIQTWWRKSLFLETRKRAVIIIQAHFRGSIARQAASRKRKCITIIQSYFKAYLVRKASKQEIARIRSRLQKSSAQVEDSMRLINKLVAAVSQLVHERSLSSIRQTCATLSTATEYSEKCCETLVSAGAVEILLKQIHLLNRGIPDQEVLKQVLLTLRNIARYSNLRTVLLSTPKTVEIVFQELLRNKADGFFIASDILKKLCESNEGRETARLLRHHIKRLHNLMQDLEKKVELQKRNGRTGAVKETNLRRLGEAATLYRLLVRTDMEM